MSDDAARPLTSDDLHEIAGFLFAGSCSPHFLLAVSGGADSMAMMHVCAQLVGERQAGRITVATVDHRLRPGSADEAEFVAREAAKLGLPHVALVWDGQKPSTGIQAQARAARYRLLASVFHGLPGGAGRQVLTAHTLDDQAETFVMRLARGSGVDGLSGIAASEPFHIAPDGAAGDEAHPVMEVRRPLLGFPKSRLVATLVARGLPWCEDPSNENEAFERVRVRRALAVLGDLGVPAEAIALSQRRIGSARDALVLATDRVLGDRRLVRIEAMGYGVLDKDLWTAEAVRPGDAVVVRVLAAVIRMVGGSERPLSLQSLEGVAAQISAAWLAGAVPPGLTIGRTKIMAGARGLSVVREEGREMPAAAALRPGQRTIWDNRFLVSLAPSAPHALELKALGRDGLALLKDRDACPPGVPAGALRTLPSLWEGARLVSVPGPFSQGPGEAIFLERSQRSFAGLQGEEAP